MNPVEVKEFLRCLNTAPKDSYNPGEWIVAPCPLAPWKHDSGTDSNPSFAIKTGPEDAFNCFMGTEIEVLVVGNCMLRKEDQDPSLTRDYKHAFELD